MCYGGPFIVAFIYIFIHTQAKGPIYGPATLWCWIDINWVALRIATCYAPAWCCILLSFCIYAFSGREIFIKRQQLRAFNNAPAEVAPVENPFTDFKTTEIRITSELATLQSPDPATDFLAIEDGAGRTGASPSPSGQHYDPYTVTIGSVLTDPKDLSILPTDPREKVMSPLPVPKVDLPQAAKPSVQQKKNRAALEANAAAWGYAKVAMLFFVSLLITWVSGMLLSIVLKHGQSAAADTRVAGPLLRQPCVFSYSPGTRLLTLHICFRRRPSVNGLLELCHLYHHLMACCDAAFYGTIAWPQLPF